MTKRKRAGILAVPSGVTLNDLEWDDEEQVIQLERQFAQVRAIGKEIADDWKRAAERELSEVTGEIETEKLLNRFDEQRRVTQEAEAALEDQYLKKLLAIVTLSREKAQAKWKADMKWFLQLMEELGIDCQVGRCLRAPDREAWNKTPARCCLRA